ncbi:MAG: GtrA family protein [Candidatus Kerfeldbacteria bacterium]|nr:GtrA family protein [Candidatus Kerfeldbacteria bacterium]
MPTNLQQFIKFILVSWLNTAVDFGSYAILTRGFLFWSDHLAWANVVALLATTMHSYVWNSYWVFPGVTHHNAKSLTKFLVVSGSGLLLNSSLFAFCIWLGANEWWSKVGLMFVLFAWNFVGNKLWVYNDK